MPVSALLLAFAAAFLHAAWNMLLAGAKDSEAATAVALVVAAVVFAPVAVLAWDVEPSAWPYIARAPRSSSPTSSSSRPPTTDPSSGSSIPSPAGSRRCSCSPPRRSPSGATSRPRRPWESSRSASASSSCAGCAATPTPRHGARRPRRVMIAGVHARGQGGHEPRGAAPVPGARAHRPGARLRGRRRRGSRAGRAAARARLAGRAAAGVAMFSAFALILAALERAPAHPSPPCARPEW